MNLYVIQCGQTDEDRAAVGRGNPQLNDAGIEYANKTGEGMKNVLLRSVYTSPLKRAFDVAMAICTEQKSESCTLLTEETLTDINYGTVTGKPKYDSDFIYYSAQPFIRFPHGESCLDIAVRVYPFIEQLKTKHVKEDEIAIVTHPAVMRVIESYFKGLTVSQFLYERQQYKNILRFTL